MTIKFLTVIVMTILASTTMMVITSLPSIQVYAQNLTANMITGEGNATEGIEQNTTATADSGILSGKGPARVRP